LKPPLHTAPQPADQENYKSVTLPEAREAITKAWKKQTDAGAVRFPSTDAIQRDPPTVISPLTAAVRFIDRFNHIHFGTPLKYRLCLDLSRSINPLLYDWPLRYADFQHHLALLRPGDWIAQADLSAFYMRLPIHRDFQRFLGVRDPTLPPGSKAGHYTSVPFGLRTAPAFASAISAEVLKVVRKRFSGRAIAYLDDFTIIAKTQEGAAEGLAILLEVLKEFGLPISPSKLVHPTQKAKILGLHVDTVAQTVSISNPHRTWATKAISTILQSPDKPIRFREFQSICGMLCWVSGVLRSGRTYLRPLWSLYKGLRRRQIAAVHLPETALAALRWWAIRLAHPISTPWLTPPDIRGPTTASDAGGDSSAGIVFQNWALQHRFTEDELTQGVPWKELFPVVKLAKILAPLLPPNSTMWSFTDSQTSAYMLLAEGSRVPSCHALLTELAEVKEKYGLRVLPIWTPRDKLSLPDWITRIDFRLLPESTLLNSVSDDTNAKTA
jgi:hypothetical protein